MRIGWIDYSKEDREKNNKYSKSIENPISAR